MRTPKPIASAQSRREKERHWDITRPAASTAKKWLGAIMAARFGPRLVLEGLVDAACVRVRLQDPRVEDAAGALPCGAAVVTGAIDDPAAVAVRDQVRLECVRGRGRHEREGHEQQACKRSEDDPRLLF